LINEIIPDLPRLHTAIAEWSACLLYIFLLKKRLSVAQIIILSIAVLPLFIIINRIGETVSVQWWISWLIIGLILMYVFIWMCADISLWDVGYIWARAFIVAEFSASLEWQIYYYLPDSVKWWGDLWSSLACLLFVGAGVLFIVWLLEHKRIPGTGRLGISPKEFGSSFLMAISAFLISNVNFAFRDTAFTGAIGTGILWVRTLVDFGCLMILFAQQEQRNEIRLKYELDAMNNVLTRQYEYYQQTKESIDIIRKQYHDLKHQIAVIRQEDDLGKRESYLAEMNHAIDVYEAQNRTGNKVLDIVLTNKNLVCKEKKINMTCVADGQILDFIEVMDICSIFGNALDNAIESVETLEDQEKRLIRVAVFSQSNFLMLRFENYCERALDFTDGLPKTTKSNNRSHGFGIRSIQTTAEKYGGSITINIEDNWFIMRVLIPLPNR
jgi:hypothetical protein